MYKYIFAVINPDSEEAFKLADSLSKKYNKLNWKKIDNLDSNNGSEVDLVVAIGGVVTIPVSYTHMTLQTNREV